MDTVLNQALEGFLGLLRQLMTNLLGPHGYEWGEELKKFLKKKPCWSETNSLMSKGFGFMCCVKPISLGVSRIPVGSSFNRTQATTLFRGGVDGDFLKLGTELENYSVQGIQTSHYLLTKYATGRDIFGQHDLDKLCLTKTQIIMWAILNKVYLPCPRTMEGDSTLFLVKVSDEFFVAQISYLQGGVGWPRGLRLCKRILSDNHIFDPDPSIKIVIPQLPA